jgi:hypothetical protein
MQHDIRQASKAPKLRQERAAQESRRAAQERIITGAPQVSDMVLAATGLAQPAQAGGSTAMPLLAQAHPRRDFSDVRVRAGRPIGRFDHAGVFLPLSGYPQGPVLQRCVSNGNPGCGCGKEDDAERPDSPHGDLLARAIADGPGDPGIAGHRLSHPGDPSERQAEAVARSITASPGTHLATGRGRPATASRAGDSRALGSVPPRAGLPGLGSGRPLPVSDRAAFEASFGRDLSAVRVYTGQDAADLARHVHARAVTVGTDIAFDAGEFQPSSTGGRMLLAHELSHVLQQTVGLGETPPVRPMMQRACAPTACPLVGEPVTGTNPVWKQAEICMQEAYEAAHPASRRGISLGFNLDWVHLTGRSPAEKEALGCLRGNFTAKSGMYQGEPDIWDFANTTMYEITTPQQAAFKAGKLAAEVSLANALTAPPECGGLFFSPGSWIPPGPCYAIGGDLYISVVNNRGVLVYQVTRDKTKEVETEALLVLLAAAAAAALKAAARAAGRKAGGRLIPAYNVATLIAAVVLLGSGKAKAQLGPGTEEPIVQLFKAMAAAGTPVPPELQQMIEADPALKATIDKAMSKGGNPSAAQQELNRQMLAIIAANKDQFSEADLEILLTAADTAQGQLPQGKQTADTIRKILDDRRAGTGRGAGRGGSKETSQRAGQATATEPGKQPAVPAQEPAQPGGQARGPAGEAGKGTAPGPGLSGEVRKQLAGASAPVHQLWDAIVGPGDGPRVTDENARRFLAEIPADLSAEQANVLITRVGPAAGASFEEILASLKQGIAELRKPASERSKEGDASVEGKTIGAGAGEQSATGATDLVKRLAAEAAKIDVKTHRRGEFTMSWKGEKDGVIEGTVRGVTFDGRPVAATVSARIDKRTDNGKRLEITYVASSPLVDSHGQIALAAANIVGKHDVLALVAHGK